MPAGDADFQRVAAGRQAAEHGTRLPFDSGTVEIDDALCHAIDRYGSEPAVECLGIHVPQLRTLERKTGGGGGIVGVGQRCVGRLVEFPAPPVAEVIDAPAGVIATAAFHERLDSGVALARLELGRYRDTLDSQFADTQRFSCG